MATAIELSNNFLNTGSCAPDLLVNRTVQEYLWEDVNNKIIDEYFNDIYKSIFSKISQWRKIGKDTKCLYEEISYLQAVSVWFIVLKSNLADCASLEDFDTKAEEMMIDCVKETLRCKYNRERVIDDLIGILGLRTPLIGIDYMAIDDDSCQVFKVD